MIKGKNTKVKDLRFEDVPLVSVIVPTYNRVYLLRETIESILSQSFNDFELIVVDNVSEDGTEQYVKGFEDPKIRYFRNSNNGIIAINRNLGIKNAKGKYLAFCDDDDLWFPHKLAKQTEFMQSNSNVGLCGGYVEEIDLQGQTRSVPQKENIVVQYYNFDRLVRFNRIVSSTAMVRRSCIENIGDFDEDRKLVGVEDFDLWLRIASKYEVAQVPALLAKIRRHAGNISRGDVQKYFSWLRILEKYDDRRSVNCRTLKMTRGIIYRRLFVRMALKRESDARLYALKCVQNSPDFRNCLYFLISLVPQPWTIHFLNILKRVSMLKLKDFQKKAFQD